MTSLGRGIGRLMIVDDMKVGGRKAPDEDHLERSTDQALDMINVPG